MTACGLPQPNSVSDSISSLVLLIWLTLQWVGLALAAGRVPLAAEYPQPGEFRAVGMLLAIQFTTSSILAPVLCNGWKISLAATVSAWVMLLAAACLAGWMPAGVLPVGALVSLWIAALWLWLGAAPTLRWQSLVASVASTFAAGGVLLWYLRLDLNPAASPEATAAFGPVTLALALPHTPSGSAWWCIAIACLGGIAVRLLLRLGRRPRPLASHSSAGPRA